MKTAKDVLKAIKDNDIKYVDFRFTDPRGKWQHVTFDVSIIDEDTFAEGIMFDGSSIAGWKAINESDMTLMPDPQTATMDPFFAASTLSIVEPVTTVAIGALLLGERVGALQVVGGVMILAGAAMVARSGVKRS